MADTPTMPMAPAPPVIVTVPTPTPTPHVASLSFTDGKKFIAWLTSSTTILGGTALLGLLGSVANGQMTLHQAYVPGISAVLAMLWPQLQASTRQDIAQAAADELNKIVSK